MAMGARLGRAFQHAGAQALPAHLQKTEARNAAHLNAGAVGLQLVLQSLFDRGIVLALFHVDKVDDDQTRQIAQTQLAGNLFGGLKVGVQRGLLDRAFLGGAARVHVDGHQRFGHADHDIAAGFQLHGRVEHAAQIAFHLIAREQRHRLGIGLHDLCMGRHDHLHEVLGHAIAFDPLDQHFLDLAVVKIADRPLDQVAFLIDRRGGDAFQRQLADLLPKAHQIFIVAADFRLGPLGPGRANDQTGAFRHFDLLRDFLQLLAVSGLGDLAGNPAPPCRVRHQHAVAPRKGQIGCQCGTLVAALFLDHLHQHDLAHLDHFLDLVFPGTRFARLADFLGHILFCDRLDLVIQLGGVIHRPIGLCTAILILILGLIAA